MPRQTPSPLIEIPHGPCQYLNITMPWRFILDREACAITQYLVRGSFWREFLPMTRGPLKAWQCFLRSRRKYVQLGLGVSGYLRALRSRGLDHVVLFNSDEHAGRHCPLVVLVGDEDAEAAAAFLSPWPGAVRCELYSVTGLPGFGHGQVPLLPPLRAAEVLAAACDGKPRADHARLCSAYQRVYLSTQAVDAADDALLDEARWTPPLEMLERMAEVSVFARAKAAQLAGCPSDKAGFVLFFIRQRAVETGLSKTLRQLIEAKGFEVLEAFALEREPAALAYEQVRGGNWGRGPFPRSGGGPAVMLAAFDLLPYAPQKISGADVDNSRIVEAKRAARDLVRERVKCEEQFNPVHSTDNASQAWRILRLIAPEAELRLRDCTEARRRQFETSETVIANLTRFGNRAKVEVVRYQGRLAVKKTYRPGAERFLRREVECLQALSDLPEVPPLIACGGNWMMIPLYQNDFRERRVFGFRLPRLLPLDVTRQLARFIEIAAGRGYDLIDLLPRNNLIIDPRFGLKVLDFEFAHKRDELRHAADTYCLRGMPPDFAGDVPAGGYAANPYPSEWQPMTGLSLDAFLNDPAWLQRIKRVGSYVSQLLALIFRKLREASPLRRLRPSAFRGQR